MKKLYLSFLWHMHQPYYKDDISGITHMPWVFLHLIKDYYELPWHHKKWGIKATFNLVPSLLKQFENYRDGFKNDKVLGLFLKETEALTKQESSLLHRYLFLTSSNQREEFALYDELYLHYGKKENLEGISSQNLLDLQVLFLLSWCGHYIRYDCALVQKMIAQGGNFTHEQKINLLNALQSYGANIIGFYKKLHDEGLIALSTTPFYHPITPLLLDKTQAKEAKKDTVLPQTTSDYTEFASYQVKEAIEYFHSLFGFFPQGFWPAEGGVSQEGVKLFAKYGIKWCASDEAILSKSKSNFTKKDIYQNYTFNFEEQSIDIRFRDRAISDAIGFNYSQMDAKDAVNNFINALMHIYDNAKDSVLVNVILDGENAWEFYRRNAYEFFTTLFENLNQQEMIEPVTMDEVQGLQMQTHTLKKLQSGSWIDGDFHIWMGHAQKNKAWELIEKTYKECYQNQNLDSKTKDIIFQELNIALGSDWFWWYGDDHYTLIKDEFDTLFRTHLINCYSVVGLEVPYQLYEPIIPNGTQNRFLRTQIDRYSLQIEQKITLFDLMMCAKVDLKKKMQAMDRKLFIKEFYYTFDEKTFYLFFKNDKALQKMELELNIDANSWNIALNVPQQQMQKLDIVIDEYVKIRYNLTNKNEVQLSYKLYDNAQKIESFGESLDFRIDTNQFVLKHWFV